MSLEEAIAANTAAIRDLIAALGSRPAKAAVAEKPKQVRGEKSAPEAEAAPEAPVVQAEPATVLTYDDIRVPFLTHLVAKKGRDAGAALLKQFGVAEGGKLSDVPEARWAEVLAAINEQVAK